MDLLGQTIGQYQLVELIHDSRLNRNVAVKVLSPARAGNQAFVQQFQQDMQLISGLEHANILPMYDYGQQDQLLYIVSRYIDTGSLQERLSQYYAPTRAQQLIRPLAQALDYMHSRGVVNGNIKPANILLDAQGQPLLTDIGYTQGLDATGLDRAYVSPEQARGEQIDRRTDVYALGALLYTLVIGEPPPLATGPSPRYQRPDLPDAVEHVILKAMAPDPAQRFQSAGELSASLHAALAPQPAPVVQPIQPQPASAPQPAPAPAAQPESKGGTNWVAILIGLAVVCLLAMICSGLFAYFGVTSQETTESPVLAPIFFWDRPDPTSPAEPPPPEEPAAPEPPPEEPAAPEPPPEEPAAPEEPPPEEPAPEEPAEGGEGG
jgi:serine/threonine protein kinase